MGNCVQGCFGNLKPLQPWLNWLVVVMELKYKLINKRHFSNQSFDSRREEKCYFVNTLKFSLTNSDSEMTRWPFQQWAFNSHQTCFFIIILLPNPLYIFCFILYPTTPYPLIYLWAPLRETERQRDREMGSSRLPPSASMAALVFGFLVLSALPELVAGVTRHYTFNVGAVQILSICRNAYS